MCDFSGQNKHHRPRSEIFQNPKSINGTERKLCGILINVKMLRKKFSEFGPLSTPRHEFNNPSVQIKKFAPLVCLQIFVQLNEFLCAE